MSKSISELALFYSGHCGKFEAAVTSLLSDQSEYNVKYWSGKVAEWNAEKEAFQSSEEVESSTYYAEEEDLVHLSSVMYGVDNVQ